MSSGKTDVTFSIGVEADAAKFSEANRRLQEWATGQQDKLDSEKLEVKFEGLSDVRDVVDSLDGSFRGIVRTLENLGNRMDRVDTSSGKVLTKWARIGGLIVIAAGAAKTYFDWVIKSEKATSGLNRQLEEQVRLERLLNEGQENRLKRLEGVPVEQLEGEQKGAEADVKASRQELENRKLNLIALRGQKTELAEVERLVGGTLGRQLQIGVEITKEADAIDSLTKKLTEQVAAYDQITEAIEKQTLAQKQQDIDERIALRKRVFLADQEAQRKKDAADAEAQRELDAINKKLGQPSVEFPVGVDNLGPSASADDRVRNLERQVRISEQSEERLSRMRDNLGRFDERRGRLRDRQDRPLGGFDRGLEAISNRIADSASGGDDARARDAEALKKINEDQLTAEQSIERATKRTADDIAKLVNKIGMQ